MSSPSLSVPASAAEALVNLVDDLYARADATLAEGGIEAVDQETIQKLFTLAVKLYVARRERGPEFSPFYAETGTATDVSVTAMAMLKAVNLDVFELSVWRAWGQISASDR